MCNVTNLKYIITVWYDVIISSAVFEENVEVLS